MTITNLENNLEELLEGFDYKSSKKFKLIAIFGLLGDFDTFEYAINLGKLIESKEFKEVLDVYTVGIGNNKGKEKFSAFTKLPINNIRTLADNKLHNSLGISQGLDIGLGGWVNMLLMLSGVRSKSTIKEVLRGYIGDRDGSQIYNEEDDINLFNIFKFSGSLFKKTCGSGYLRPFELATFRLTNMIEIISNWEDYILSADYLPQRGATFLLDQNNNVVYEYYANDILSYSKEMSNPLNFINKIIK